MATARRIRLDPSVFHLPVERMREGYYSDKYFVRAREILIADGYAPQRHDAGVRQVSTAYLGGMDEAIAILKLCADDWSALTVHALYDGDHDRAVGDGDDHRGPVRRSRISRRSTSACSRGARGWAPTRAAWSRQRIPRR